MDGAQRWYHSHASPHDRGRDAQYIPYTIMAVGVAHNERQLIILWTRGAGHGMDRAVRMKVGLARGEGDH